MPYVNEYGETIIKEEVIEHPHHEASIIRYKAPKPQNSPMVQPTQESRPTPGPIPGPTPTPLPYNLYAPLINKPEFINAGVLVIAY